MAGKTNYNPKSLKNLKSPPELLTPEQMRAAQSKGGRTAAENRRKSALFRDIIREIGSKRVSKRKMSENLRALADMYGIDGDISADTLLILAQYEKAIASGDTDAARFLRDTSGQAPTQAVQIGPLDAQSVDMASLSDEQIAAQIAELEDGSGMFDGSFDGNSAD